MDLLGLTLTYQVNFDENTLLVMCAMLLQVADLPIIQTGLVLT